MLILEIAILLAVLAVLALLLKARSPEADPRITELEKSLERSQALLREEFARSREEMGRIGKEQREEIGGRMDKLTASNEQKQDQIRKVMEERLEEMRKTVDEKLQGTLEKRLGESFKMVSERLEQVHKGLGEMQTLATGVGDLKRVLTNVKARGTWGEYQLVNLLEQVLTPGQYVKNAEILPGSREVVEFAVKMPGRDNGGSQVLLPIDSKFPMEDYTRLVDASALGDLATVEAASKALEARVKSQAKDIKEKYIHPPHSTEFGILFLPTEGLYAEIAKRPGLIEELQNKYRVTVAGPSNLMMLLNALNMGFRTLALEKRSSEVWSILSAVKGEFGKFGEILDKVQKKIREAGDTIEDANKKTRTISLRLKNVEGGTAQPQLGEGEEG